MLTNTVDYVERSTALLSV